MELRESKQARIVPIWIGGPDKTPYNLFSSDGYSDDAHCHPLSPGRFSVKEIMKSVFALQGEFISDEKSVIER